ncbi:MAG TPA: hypothetical protein VGG89_04435 [Candidatus Baltobacteraceae bacterium]|jgi:uncharacterized membrane protein
MLSVLDRYVAATYLKYYALSIAVLCLPMLPLLLRFSLSAAYVLAVLSIAGSGALCAALLELGYRREMTTLQRYGVGHGQMFRPLLGAALAPLAAVSAFAVLVSAARAPALYWSVAGLCAVTLCAVVAFRGAWAKRESGTGKACIGGFACHLGVLAGALAWTIR